ncbi:NACHT, LRR and PYD domains-containing protein 12 [Bagarius yarrelli]|uniref:NACHT, LRR and PYD domains-containing protein 12 n=1 Tax=Bagarius yarrelli TaxID=175774 RepID=A0A556V6J3_BAGYA|nr:NACHT, LRR and PYD domains-containing protein 12 [Bagarius yarrelli]
MISDEKQDTEPGTGLSDCKLSVGSCRALAGVLSSNSSILIELDLSDNKLKDEGVDLLSVGLKCEQCKLEILWLKHCGISDEGYVALAVALRSNPMSNLRELNLNCNEPGDRGVKMLSDLKENTNYRLQSLSIVPDPYEMDKGYQSYIFNKASNLDMDLFYFIKSQKHCQRTFQTYDL